jgi:hypothetical protein
VKIIVISIVWLTLIAAGFFLAVLFQRETSFGSGSVKPNPRG